MNEHVQSVMCLTKGLKQLNTHSREGNCKTGLSCPALHRCFLIRTGSGQNVRNNTVWTQEEGLIFKTRCFPQTTWTDSDPSGQLVLHGNQSNTNFSFRPQTRLIIDPLDFLQSALFFLSLESQNQIKQLWVCNDGGPVWLQVRSLFTGFSAATSASFGSSSAHFCSWSASSAMFHLWERAGEMWQTRDTTAGIQRWDRNI